MFRLSSSFSKKNKGVCYMGDRRKGTFVWLYRRALPTWEAAWWAEGGQTGSLSHSSWCMVGTGGQPGYCSVLQCSVYVQWVYSANCTVGGRGTAHLNSNGQHKSFPNTVIGNTSYIHLYMGLFACFPLYLQLLKNGQQMQTMYHRAGHQCIAFSQFFRSM